MNTKALRFKVAVYPALALLAALALFSLLLVRHQRNEALAEATRHVTQLSEMLIRSTRFAMLQNQPEYVHRIIQDVARQNNIEKVRIFSKDGVIIDSTYEPELGMKVNRKAEGCFHCHRTDKPAQQIPRSERARMFVAPGGRRMLASMEVIRNEPSCYNSACHVHSREQSVLGVLDIVYSIDEIDSATHRSVAVIAALLIGLVVLASALMSLLVHRLIYVPLRDLESLGCRLADWHLLLLLADKRSAQPPSVAPLDSRARDRLMRGDRVVNPARHNRESNGARRGYEAAAPSERSYVLPHPARAPAREPLIGLPLGRGRAAAFGQK